MHLENMAKGIGNTYPVHDTNPPAVGHSLSPRCIVCPHHRFVDQMPNNYTRLARARQMIH
jgi:hypothetical protein